jgi:predicted Zn-dependent peptidase
MASHTVTVTLTNGLRVLYRQSAGLPLSAGTMLISGGASTEAPNEAGLCNLTNELLMQGTRRKNGKLLAQTLERYGIFMGTQASEDYSEIGFIAPASQLERAFDLMAEVLGEPAFAPNEIAKERAQTLAALKTRHDAIFNIAHDRLAELLFDTHPYGRLVDGKPETVKSFSAGDLRRWHEESAQAHRAILSVVSPLPWATVRRSLTVSLTRWGKTANAAGRMAFGRPEILAKTVVEEIKSQSEQAYLMIGMQAPSASEPDFLALKVLNTALGGGMSSRLFLRLREQEGLAYEVSSFFPTRLQTSQWVVYLGCSPDKLELAHKRLVSLLAEVADRGLSASELRQAKEMMKGSFALDFQTRRRQAWYAAWWAFLGRRSGYEREFKEAVEAISSKNIRAVAERLLSQPRVTVRVAPR